jgi:hypothetical protein
VSRIGLVLAGVAAAVVLSPGAPGAADDLRLLVSGRPYETVWTSTMEAMAARYPVALAGQGIIVTERVERAPRPLDAPWEAGMDRVAEKVTVWVESFGDRLTQLRVRIEAEGSRGGVWTPLAVDETAARDLLTYLRDASATR